MKYLLIFASLALIIGCKAPAGETNAPEAANAAPAAVPQGAAPAVDAPGTVAPAYDASSAVAEPDTISPSSDASSPTQG